MAHFILLQDALNDAALLLRAGWDVTIKGDDTNGGFIVEKFGVPLPTNKRQTGRKRNVTK